MDVTREVVVDASIDEVWQALTDAAEVSAWFGGEVSIDPRVGGAASFVDPDCSRSAVVEAVEYGQRLALRWWADDDPDAVSTVVFSIEQTDGATRVVVTETMSAASSAFAGSASCSISEASLHWADRLVGLELRFLAAPAPALTF